MLVIYTAAGEQPRQYVFRVDELTPDLYEPIEQVGPWDALDGFVEALMAGNRRAWRVALWTCLRRDALAAGGEDVDLVDVTPTAGQLVLRYEPAEELLMAEAALADPGLPADRRAFYEGILPGLREAAGKADEGPAASGPDDAPTGGTSPTSSD